METCGAYDPRLDFFRSEGYGHYRLSGFKRVADISLYIQDMREKRMH